MKVKLFSLILLFIFQFNQLYSQGEEVLLKDGRKVILFNDGTWKLQDSTHKNSKFDKINCNDLIGKEKYRDLGFGFGTFKIFNTIKPIFVLDEKGKNGFEITMDKWMSVNDTNDNHIGIILSKIGDKVTFKRNFELQFIYVDGSSSKFYNTNDEYKDDSYMNQNSTYDGIRPNVQIPKEKKTLPFEIRIYNYRNSNDFKNLLNKKISQIKVLSSDGYLIYNFDDQDQIDFYNTINCLAR